MRRNSCSMVWSGNPWQPPGGPETGLFMLGADTCRLRNLMHRIPVNSAHPPICFPPTYLCAPSTGLGAIWQDDTRNQLPVQQSSCPHPLAQHEMKSGATKTRISHKSLTAAALGPGMSLNVKSSRCLSPGVPHHDVMMWHTRVRRSATHTALQVT